MLGRKLESVLPAVTEEDIRITAHRELAGYWTTAARRPWWWLDRSIIDLGLTFMARGRYAIFSGNLLTKTAAIEDADASRWLIEQMRVRRHGRDKQSPTVSERLARVARRPPYDCQRPATKGRDGTACLSAARRLHPGGPVFRAIAHADQLEAPLTRCDPS